VDTLLHNYAEVRAYLEREHPDWLRGSDATEYQRASRPLTPESAGGLISKRRDAFGGFSDAPMAAVVPGYRRIIAPCLLYACLLLASAINDLRPGFCKSIR
jgi:hypothetical protein